MYSEEEDTPRIIEIEDNGLDSVSDVEGPADPYMDLQAHNLHALSNQRWSDKMGSVDES